MSRAKSSEVERFQKLQQRLPAIWERIVEDEAYEHTSVVIPSQSVDQEELAKIEGAPLYEERLLFSLIRLRHPHAHVIYVTSQPIHPDIVDYYLQLLSGVPTGHARRRLHVLCAYDNTAKPLTDKILERPRLVERIKSAIGNRQAAYMTCFNSTPRERELAIKLGIPLNSADPELLWLGTKSGSRQVFDRAGVNHPMGYENLGSRRDIVEALYRLHKERPGIQRAVIKLNDSFSGEGNAIFEYPELPKGDGDAARSVLEHALETVEWSASGESLSRFFEKFAEMGGIVEQFLEGTDKCSPSAQLRVQPDGVVEVLSTHDQLLGGTHGQVYLGCRFPADPRYREQVMDAARRIGEELSSHGVIGRSSIDFVALRKPDGGWQSYAIEINLRMGGTTPPFLALQFLTGGELNQTTGSFLSQRGQEKFYYATDNLKSPAYKGLLPEDLMDLSLHHGLQYRPSTETGVLFHMIGALSQYGKLGLTCLGDSPEEAKELYERTAEILDRACHARRRPKLTPLLDRGRTLME